jgi:ribosome-binding factor A
LNNSVGEINRGIIKKIKMKYYPKLTFEVDQGLAHAAKVQNILNSLNG